MTSRTFLLLNYVGFVPFSLSSSVRVRIQEIMFESIRIHVLVLMHAEMSGVILLHTRIAAQVKSGEHHYVKPMPRFHLCHFY